MSFKNSLMSFVANMMFVRSQKEDLKQACNVLQEDLVQPIAEQTQKVYNACKQEALSCEAKSIELARARLLMEAEVEAERVKIMAKAEAEAAITRAQCEIEVAAMKAAAKRAAAKKEAEAETN